MGDPLAIDYRVQATGITIDVSGINEKFNIGIYCGAKDNFFCIFIGPDLHSHTKFPVIREKNFTVIPFLLEEFGSSTISHLFRKRLMTSVRLTALNRQELSAPQTHQVPI